MLCVGCREREKKEVRRESLQNEGPSVCILNCSLILLTWILHTRVVFVHAGWKVYSLFTQAMISCIPSGYSCNSNSIQVWRLFALALIFHQCLLQSGVGRHWINQSDVCTWFSMPSLLPWRQTRVTFESPLKSTSLMSKWRKVSYFYSQSECFTRFQIIDY